MDRTTVAWQRYCDNTVASAKRFLELEADLQRHCRMSGISQEEAKKELDKLRRESDQYAAREVTIYHLALACERITGT